MTITFYDASDNSVIGTNTLVESRIATTIWKELTYSQTYNWYAIADDGTDITTSSTF